MRWYALERECGWGCWGRYERERREKRKKIIQNNNNNNNNNKIIYKIIKTNN